MSLSPTQMKEWRIWPLPVMGRSVKGSLIVKVIQSCPWLFVTPWTIQSKGFSRQEYWRGSHSLLQGIFPTQGSNAHLLLGRWILYHWAPWEALILNPLLPYTNPMQSTTHSSSCLLLRKYPSVGPFTQGNVWPNWWLGEDIWRKQS